MERDQKIHAVAAFIIAAAPLLEQREESKRWKQRKEWTKKWLLQWNEKGLYNNLVSELRLEEQRQYQNYVRMKKTLIGFCI